MKRYRISALLMAFLMTLSAFPARAAGVELEVQDTTGGVELSLTGLEEEYCGIQITVAVGDSSNAAFELSEELTSRGAYCTRKDGNDGNVTIYLVAKSPLNEGDTVSLGTLTGRGAHSVSMVACKLLTTALEGELPDLEGPSSGPSGTSPGTTSPPGSSGRPGTSSRPPSGTDTVDSTEPPEPSKPSDDKPSGDQEVPSIENPSLPGELPFPDVTSAGWYYTAVAYVYRAELMRGMDDGSFHPEGTTTRAQLVTILHRLEGEPPPLSFSGFTDVPDGLWCAPAVSWAAENKIVEGYGGNRFGPGDGISREQMAAILYRYVRYRNGDLSARRDLSVFPDADSISGWTGAVEAMEWAVGTGLIAGRDGLLDPQGTATRAQMATILMRFCENILQR